MNILAITLLQTSAGAPGAAPAGGSGMFWIMMILLFVIMWAFMIRPQRKQQKELEKFRNELKRGDKVVTAGGIYGTVKDVDEANNILKVEIANGICIQVDKGSVYASPQDNVQ